MIHSLLNLTQSTHLRFKEVDNWTCLSSDILHCAHLGHIYDLLDSDPDHVRVDLRRLQGGHDVPVYDADGFRIRQRVPTPSRSRTSGALADLTKIHDLFTPNERGKKTYHTYPFAFTKCFGNVQSSTTLHPYDLVLDKINRVLTPPANEDNADADADESDADGSDSNGKDKEDERR
ncbi:hypothetical protein JVT61DRAFT_12032 [Boletus reticuloceps]|uniref:Uncharacterized protein n=1 Tax=Boletus reticuloceps TaxID=495285 RepID=A0A8I2YEM0_9AGAM|nr:hypothetical protein JVT61DRAFT_12032 [Boletus reticuloceps]